MAADSRFLDELPADARAFVLQRARRRRFARKEVLFHQDDPAETLHLLDKGWVAIRAVTALGDVATLDLLGEGAIFGELALLPPTHGHRSATVQALEPTQTLEIPATVFMELCTTSVPALTTVLSMMAGRERRLTRRLVEALYFPVETRLIRRLIEIDDQYGPQSGGQIPLTQDDLASLAGTTRETANRVLRRLEEAGAIALAKGSFTVVDHDALQRKAGTKDSLVN